MPKPTLSFLIPSLKDEEKLECRVFIPHRLLRLESPQTPTTPQSRKSASEDEAERVARAAMGFSSLDGAHGVDVDMSRKKTAIIAHPYAPLGGSFDDNVVHEATKIMLDHGFIVGTFNFRGAGQSKGHTSWSAKPEVSDYMAFVGFMAVFMTYLDIHPKPSSTPNSEAFGDYGLTTIPSEAQLPSLSPTTSTPISPRGSTIDMNGTAPTYDGDKPPLLVMAGYSYGSLITQLLPPLAEILETFTQPAVRTTSSEIRFRARELADVQNRAHFDRLAHEREYMSRHTFNKSHGGIRMGSEDDSRKSRDHHHRPSLHLERLEHHEWARKSVDRVRSIRRSMDALSPSRRGKHNSWVQDDGDGRLTDEISDSSDGRSRLSAAPSAASARPATSPASEAPSTPKGGPVVLSKDDAAMFSDPVLRAQMRSDPAVREKVHVENGTLLPLLTFHISPAYLLISPLQGAIGGLATMFATTPTHQLLPSLPFFAKKPKEHKFTSGELKLVHSPALAVYGGSDGFSNVEKMRKWTNALRQAPESRFQAVEVQGAGHFWHEHAHLEELKDNIRAWIEELE